MRQQLTPEAISVLIAGLVVFWVSVAVMVRLHRSHRLNARAARRAPESNA